MHKHTHCVTQEELQDEEQEGPVERPSGKGSNKGTASGKQKEEQAKPAKPKVRNRGQQAYNQVKA
jgi:hypothetical protein